MARTSFLGPVALLIGFALVTTVPAFAGEIIVSAGWNVAAGPVYTVGTPAPPYDGDEAFLMSPPGSIAGSGTLVPMNPLAPPNNLWQFEGMMTWAASAMIDDRSGTAGAGIAEADFAAGGEIQIDGVVKNLYQAEIYNGTLLIGDVSAFTLQETGSDTNNLDVIAGITVTVTGGLLTSTGAMEIPVGTAYELAFTLIQANNSGGDVDDFTDNIWTTDGSQFLMGYIPEPATLALLALGGLALVGRRR